MTAVESGDNSVVARVMAAMSEQLKGLTPEEIALEKLAVLREWYRVLNTLPPGTEIPADLRAPAPAPPSDDGLARLPLKAAAIEYLRSCKNPQTIKQIALGLEAAGREFESENPTIAVRGVLRKALKTDDDLIHLGYAKWHLRSVYKQNPKKLQKLLSSVTTNGTGGRSAAEHGARTREGMERRRAKGLRVGQPLRLTAEMYEKYLALRHDGMSKGAAVNAIGMSAASLYNYLTRFHMDSWKPGDPWPPPQREREGAKSSAPAEEPGNVVQFAKASNE
jgi:hypothetical protein